MRSFNCDMYWPRLNMYWESSGFGLGVFYIRGVYCWGEGIIHTHIYIYAYAYVYLYSAYHDLWGYTNST